MKGYLGLFKGDSFSLIGCDKEEGKGGLFSCEFNFEVGSKSGEHVCITSFGDVSIGTSDKMEFSDFSKRCSKKNISKAASSTENSSVVRLAWCL